ncbi:amidohydrolase [Agromyces badenianii]|uniref:Amidohydrolase n=1 Tax=Agromyces badenianii TaxID=2080742 RepID=A0A2S0WU84_9MICO|nr:amidohydrolase family protein [Agromyces badenianii]AWB94804.1 amidohydrolase [Agromyces badenianii]
MTGTDVHTHLVPTVGAADAAAAGLSVDANGRLLVADHAAGPAVIYRPDALAAWLDTAGLDRALVSIPPPLYRQGLDEPSARSWARSVNDALFAQLVEHPRLDALGYLPFEHPEVAREELDRLAASEHPVGFTAAAGGRSVSLADPRLRPVWSRLVELDIPLLLHPGGSPDTRLDDAYLHNLIGNPHETAIAASQLLLGEVLSSYPGLRIALVHGGGTLPALLGRLQQGVRSRRPGVPEDIDLRAQARGLWSDCLTHDEGALRLAAGVFGTDHLLLGSDWPFPMGYDDPLAHARDAIPEHASRIAGTNADDYLGHRLSRGSA